MKTFVISVLCSCFLVTVQLVAQEGGQKRAVQLKQWLERFPDADTNNDGVLTEAEAKAYREKLAGQRSRNTRPDRLTPTFADVKYGTHERQVLDLYLAKSEDPTPLIIYIHGGGFVGGDKKSVSPAIVKAANEAGISVAAIHYRFVSELPFPAPQEDAARAIQFLRANAKKWNFDKSLFAAYGGSAGAGLSLWLGFHDDLADPESNDPIARESTRLVAVGSRGGQTTYDPNVIKAWVGGRAYEHPSIFKCYGIESIDQITDPKLQPLYDQVSAIKHLTADDPPVYSIYSEADAPLPANARPGQGIHHPVFAHKLDAEMDKLQIEHVYRHVSHFKGDRDLDMFDHIKKWFAQSRIKQQGR